MNFYEYFNIELPDGLFAFINTVKNSDGKIVGITFRQSDTGRANKSIKSECVSDAEYQIDSLEDGYTVECKFWKLKSDFTKWFTEESELSKMISDGVGEPVPYLIIKATYPNKTKKLLADARKSFRLFRSKKRLH